MAEGCPAPAVLVAFAAGELTEDERTGIEAHLAECLPCAVELERMTRTQLDLLVGQRGPSALPPPATHPVLDTVMRQAAESGGNRSRFDSERVLAILDPPAAEGALGSFAGHDVLEIAGSGGMGVVLKARDRTLERVVAIKVLFPAGRGDDSFTARFLEEARAVAAIHHDHIVTVHHAGMAKGLAYLVMPFHAEGTLEGHLARTPKLAPMEVARVGLQLARALAATHARDILHRDLKPSNVLLEQGLKRVRLADFGLAQSRASGPSAAGKVESPDAIAGLPKKTVAGTPHYMSPEQARGETIDARSDLFGLGAVLFRMATGQNLYAGESSQEVLRSATRCELKPVRELAPEVAPALAAVIDRLLAKRAEDRFASAEEAAGEFERFLDTERRVRLWARRTAAGALAACLAVCAVVAGLDGSGRTAVVNSLLCIRTGDVFFIRGRFGTYPELPEAVRACRPGETIEARFSGERLTDGFRVGGKPITIRARKNFTPTLVATNEGQALILADGPLILEGLTLSRRSNRIIFAPLVSAEAAPVWFLNCRFVRAPLHGEPALMRGGRLAPPDDGARAHRPLIRLGSGGSAHLRNCMVIARLGSAFGLWGLSKEPLHIETENSLFVIPRAFTMRPDSGTRIDLKSARSVFVTMGLVDLDDAGSIDQFTAHWEDCILDRTQGVLLRLSQYRKGQWPRALAWRETNVFYSGQGGFLSDRRGRRIDTEPEWNALMGLDTNSHRLTNREVLANARGRSSQRLNASDVDAEDLVGAPGSRLKFSPLWIGEGEPYARFRREPGYREWQEQVRSAIQEWEQSRASKPQRN